MLNPYDIGPNEPEMISIKCPNCRADINEVDNVYVIEGNIVGCECCVSQKMLYEVIEQ